MKTYAEYLAQFFEGKVQKLPIDTARGCPNRDGSIGTGGCSYCLNAAFSPDYGKRALGINEQIARGKKFFAGKYGSMRYLAYFQSETPTNTDLPTQLADYSEALTPEDIVGLVLATRPDCIPDELIDLLVELPKPVFIEIGAESMHDATLERVNRRHTVEQIVDAVRRCAAAGLHVGLHLIFGLPGEDEEMMLDSVRRINELPIESIKFHHLQILRGTELGRQWERGQLRDIISYTPERYAALCHRVLALLRPDIAVERFLSQSPRHLVLHPRWNLKPSAFAKALDERPDE